MTLNVFQSFSNMIPKLPQHDPRMIPEGLPNELKIISK
jgi:hypothetical protein